MRGRGTPLPTPQALSTYIFLEQPCLLLVWQRLSSVLVLGSLAHEEKDHFV